MNIFVNIAIYQVIWFLCILYGNWGALFSLPLIGLHLVITNQRRADLKMMGLLLIAGLLIDSTLNAIGFFGFNDNTFPIPFWLMMIWIGLATLVHHSLSWLKNRLFLSAIFGALGGPLAYWAGVRMGAAAFNWPLITSLMLLAGIWILFWPGVM